ncbi:MAG: PASTA domain-containing protein [Bacteroidetes bacterium]|nr:MAG: PASTA domain-containing protein [Bacteroidota bacterium]REK03486.1 MAG: PASTA domain-containing protein [Bacteroidota bacterium]REK34791.1 MAG: PASTA domain-containing protein [Bacteroidota bacterium]REK51330.1 MAG: PASTA domain-containing protein [Bacteroidota bacterium]
MKIKKDIFWRIHLSFIVLCMMGLAIIVQIVRIQFVEGEQWKEKANSMTLKYFPIEASRGNIYSSDMSMLATSVPMYDIRFDTRASGLSTEYFKKNLDSLAISLSSLFKDKSWQQYRQELKEAHAEKQRYYLVKRNVNYAELQKIKQFPLFRAGRNKGGLLVEQRNVRELPYKKLASRVIGTLRDVKPVGIEAAFDEELKGTHGKRLMQRLSGNVWMPVRDRSEMEPRDGRDVISTIDIHIQDVAEQSLEEHLRFHNADHGCTILMDVQTGEIKAIANLSKTADGNYDETFNYAIAESTEPGSTFKLASLLAAMEDGLVSPEDTVDVGSGQMRFYGQIMKDSHPPKKSRMSVQEVFETSSNVGVSKLINRLYLKNPQAFVDRLHSFGLNDRLDLQIDGEGKPRIKTVRDKDWSGVSLPWMSIGYETKLTPLQILTFYNAVANNGKMVKPKFVREIQHHGKTVKKFPTEILRDSIAGEKSIMAARRMMEGVVERGTATSLNKSPYKIAGKTGTAQIANPKYGYDIKMRSYQASFVGYFPADEPRYSCIVVVYAPSNNFYYGGAVAAPIFKEIADKVYSNHLDFQNSPLQQDTSINTLPLALAGVQKDTRRVLAGINIPVVSDDDDAKWINPVLKEDKLLLTERVISMKSIPNVVGMGAKDATYVLENSGLRVLIVGRGAVIRQSIAPGSKIERGQTITIELG